MPEPLGLEPVAILVAGLASGALGALWYSGALFGPAWGLQLYLIQTGYRATYLVLMGAISGSWPR